MRPWWQPQGVARRFVTDLVAGEMARQRRAGVPPMSEWQGGWRLDEDLGADSLELVALATALAEALHLHESGIEDYLLARRTLDDWVAIAQAGLERFSARLTFRTSGSSGVPKPCVHPLADLLQETQHLATLLPGRRRVLCAVPSHHIYGFLFSVLLPRDLGLDPEDVIDLRVSTPSWLSRGARPGDLVIAHPMFWQATARTVPQLPPDVVGVSSTAPCPDAVAEALQAAGLARLVQVYGSSETAGIAARDSHEQPFTLFPYWRAAGGSDLVRTLAGGGESTHAAPDRLDFCGPRSFRVSGRHDAAVQVGGINVFPGRVREVLRRHPDVHDAAVRLMRPEEGERLKAFVVPRPGVAADDAFAGGLRAWVDRELAVPERPRAFRFGNALPESAAGKPADWDLE